MKSKVMLAGVAILALAIALLLRLAGHRLSPCVRHALWLLVAMPLVALSYHPPLQHFQGSKQRRCSVAFIVVGHGSATPLF